MLLNSGVFCVRLVAMISTWLRRLMNDGFINRSEIRYRASFAQKQCFRLMNYSFELGSVVQKRAILKKLIKKSHLGFSNCQIFESSMEMPKYF